MVEVPGTPVQAGTFNQPGDALGRDPVLGSVPGFGVQAAMESSQLTWRSGCRD